MALLDGTRAIVTGGASGIGEATARRMAGEGARVALVDRDSEGVERVARDIGGVAIEADLSSSAIATAAVDDAAQQLGGLDFLVNNAGIGNLKRLHDYTDDEWHLLVDVNLTAAFATTRAAVPHLRRAGGGSIVNVASVSGVFPTRGEAPYAAAKAAVIALTRSTALEYGGAGIRANCVSPGFIRTPLTEVAFSQPGWIERIEQVTPLGRAGGADEVAGVIVFLCSGLASYVTGQNLLVDGGSILPNAQMDHVLGALLGPDEAEPPGPSGGA